MKESLLSVRGLTTSFRTDRGKVTAVDDVSFDVAPGETLAIVGESGSGKSVTALSILRLLPDPPGRIEGGQILFEEKDLAKLSDREIRSIRGDRIAMIFQEPMSSLNPTLSVGMQIAEPMNLHRKTPWSKALDAARELLNRVRIPDAASKVNAWPHQFSGGQRQRAMIAMALACKPRLIIADEPTTALDVTVQAQILDLLKEITRETKAALILITHDLGVVARYADKVAVMYGGRIIEQASAEELYAHPKHPYTVGLLASVPRLDSDVNQRLVPIEGSPPDLAALPVGCAFAPRCRWAGPDCIERRPPLIEVGDNHLNACFRNDLN
ncbi:ABC transporter ATP-binding protein [Noviherbaspirillum sp. Root189]|uniref:ABC transporter ATP-binding protein n=1 Tax=Noviherbaspirillum sp. Root189 TaxID=1736487 RepID=UPI0007102142|nr:ABC transporter ATP-binding protein [Noviherbaspirillum sp. Root189]KRB82161.1 peptide ABC transporter ATP-binding protein [Noviherbaspirillum sp. Root189]